MVELSVYKQNIRRVGQEIITKDTQNFGIIYHTNGTQHVRPKDSNFFYGFSNTAFVNADNKKSILGYVFLSSGGAIMWGLKKQATIALLSPEAEYVTLSEAAHEAMWLHHLYGELGFI